MSAAATHGTSGTSTMGTMIMTTGGMNQPPFAACGSTPWLTNSSAAKTTLMANASTIPTTARTATSAAEASADRTDGPTVAMPTASTRMPAGNVAYSAPVTGFAMSARAASG